MSHFKAASDPAGCERCVSRGIRIGLVSITFRRRGVAEIIQLACRAALTCIEWGGDVHVPHGNLALAHDVRAMTLDAGLAVAAYGSYYAVGLSPSKGLEFGPVLSSATALGAPTIRVWAGRTASADASEEDWRRTVLDAQHIADMAANEGLTISFEHHSNTLTDTLASTRRLHEAIGRPNVRHYWQPQLHDAMEHRLHALRTLLPHLTNLHVFHWTPGAAGAIRHPLAAGAEQWREYLRIASSSGTQYAALLEFVREDACDQLLEDARTLREWVDSLSHARPAPGPRESSDMKANLP